ncbi:hypothetical protein FIBSPDRAFT_903985 [Athelia psychrophila]|uniref:Uncharacterized protein n=1 Tax=Athelia psychrophila TaxID=1759441 RepID=A0A167VBE9_9AGAM|nr:hypothetical protein FIBSPDRAFT_903985 [Fibularhizoctonia sp. CBS 109695]
MAFNAPTPITGIYHISLTFPPSLQRTKSQLAPLLLAAQAQPELSPNNLNTSNRRCAIAEIGLAIMQDTVQRVYRTDAPRVVILKGPGSKRAGGGGGPRDASGDAVLEDSAAANGRGETGALQLCYPITETPLHSILLPDGMSFMDPMAAHVSLHDLMGLLYPDYRLKQHENNPQREVDMVEMK